MPYDDLMPYAEWMKLTDGGTFSRRGAELEAVDTALRRFHDSPDINDKKRNELAGALERWKAGTRDWKTSVRNRLLAVESLSKQIYRVRKAPAPAELKLIRDEASGIISRLFEEHKLVFRPGIATKFCGNTNMGKVKTSATIAGTAWSAAELANRVSSFSDNLLKSMIPQEDHSDVVEALSYVMPGFKLNLQANLVPYVSLAVTGGEVLFGAGKTLYKQYELSQFKMHADRALSTGDPEKVLAAVVVLLERERNNGLANLGVGMAEFASKAGAILLDGGTVSSAAIGVASGLAKLALLVRLVVRDWQEKKRANALLKGVRELNKSNPAVKVPVGVELFQVCPIMGAYLVCCAPSSVLVNSILSDDEFYRPGMQVRVERAVQRHITPLRNQAQRLVAEHRMYIKDFNYVGLLARNEKALDLMKEKFGKSEIAKSAIAS